MLELERRVNIVLFPDLLLLATAVLCAFVGVCKILGH